jgi:hypothetical protein
MNKDYSLHRKNSPLRDFVLGSREVITTRIRHQDDLPEFLH